MILRDGKGYIPDERVKFIENILGIIFPKAFVDLVRDEDGGDPEENWEEILYKDPESKKNRGTGIGAFLALNHDEFYGILYHYENPMEGFPKGLIAFAKCGGDCFCFDYREGKHLQDPPIVYWIQGNEPGKDIAFLANNFEDFIGMFKPEGYYDHLLGGSSGE